MLHVFLNVLNGDVHLARNRAMQEELGFNGSGSTEVDKRNSESKLNIFAAYSRLYRQIVTPRD